LRSSVTGRLSAGSRSSCRPGTGRSSRPYRRRSGSRQASRYAIDPDGNLSSENLGGTGNRNTPELRAGSARECRRGRPCRRRTTVCGGSVARVRCWSLWEWGVSIRSSTREPPARPLCPARRVARVGTQRGVGAKRPSPDRAVRLAARRRPGLPDPVLQFHPPSLPGSRPACHTRHHWRLVDPADDLGDLNVEVIAPHRGDPISARANRGRPGEHLVA